MFCLKISVELRSMEPAPVVKFSLDKFYRDSESSTSAHETRRRLHLGWQKWRSSLS